MKSLFYSLFAILMVTTSLGCSSPGFEEESSPDAGVGGAPGPQTSGAFGWPKPVEETGLTEEETANLKQGLTGCQTWPPFDRMMHAASGVPVVIKVNQTCTPDQWYGVEPRNWLMAPPTFLGIPTNPVPPTTRFGLKCSWMGPLSKATSCVAKQKFACDFGGYAMVYDATYEATTLDWSKVWMTLRAGGPAEGNGTNGLACQRVIYSYFHATP